MASTILGIMLGAGIYLAGFFSGKNYRRNSCKHKLEPVVTLKRHYARTQRLNQRYQLALNEIARLKSLISKSGGSDEQR